MEENLCIFIWPDFFRVLKLLRLEKEERRDRKKGKKKKRKKKFKMGKGIVARRRGKQKVSLLFFFGMGYICL